MKSILLVIATLLPLSLWAQVYPVPPLPPESAQPTEMKTCEELLIAAQKDEKSFVESGHKKKYRSEKDFFKEIERRLLSDSVKKVSKDGIVPKVGKCTSEELELLNRISEIYKKADRCIPFRESLRVNYTKKIDELISINEE